jgi:hypothetical protein
MSEKIEATELISYVSSAALAATAIILMLTTPVPVIEKGNSFNYYWGLFSNPLLLGGHFLALACVAVGMTWSIIALIAAALRKKDPSRFFSLGFLKKSAKQLLSGARDFFKLWTPVIISILFLSFALAALNQLNVSRLKDELVVGWDKALTSSYPFIAFQNVAYPEWIINSIKFSFFYLPVIFIFFSLYLFFSHRDRFREIAAAFCLSLAVLLFFWEIVPVLSPHDRFLDNVYALPISADIGQNLVSNYHPQPSIELILQKERKMKTANLGGVMPTSTFPSAHVVWAALLAYYAYKTRRELGLLLGIVAFLSIAGTVLFAQHYFVDVPAGIIVAAASIFIVNATTKNSSSLSKFQNL